MPSPRRQHCKDSRRDKKPWLEPQPLGRPCLLGSLQSLGTLSNPHLFHIYLQKSFLKSSLLNFHPPSLQKDRSQGTMNEKSSVPMSPTIWVEVPAFKHIKITCFLCLLFFGKRDSIKTSFQRNLQGIYPIFLTFKSDSLPDRNISTQLA